MKAVVFTLGCKVNACESASLLTGLKELGYEVSDKLGFADLYILNTCAVTSEAEKKSRQAVARIRKINSAAKIIVTGCAAQNSPKSFLDKQGVYLVTGAINKDKIISLINESGLHLDEGDCYYERFMPSKGERTRAYIKVQDGCENFCAYCLIPYLRGACRSRDPKKVREEILHLGVKEAVITGINLTAYNYEGLKLYDLIESLSDLDIRLRLGSLEENVVTDRFLSALSLLKDFAPHFHLSLQSGSDKVLKEMNRKYCRDEFVESINKIRKVFPDAAITTDIIVGFPTETEQDFSDTLSMCQAVNFADIHCFVFSPRKGTKAYDMPQLDAQTKNERLQRLIKVKEESRKAFSEKFIGKTLSVLPEMVKDGYIEGYSSNYIRCYIKSTDFSEEIISVKATGLFKDGLLCEIQK